MESIYLIGDIHTVNAFRICCMECFNADPDSSPGILKMLLAREGTAVILVTRDCAEPAADVIKKVNFESGRSVVIEIPGIDDESGFGRSLTSYITEALGVAL